MPSPVSEYVGDPVVSGEREAVSRPGEAIVVEEMGRGAAGSCIDGDVATASISFVDTEEDTDGERDDGMEGVTLLVLLSRSAFQVGRVSSVKS